MDSGEYDFLQKPFNINELSALVEKLFSIFISLLSHCLILKEENYSGIFDPATEIKCILVYPMVFIGKIIGCLVFTKTFNYATFA
ncbi:MAG: hypothetical protein LBU10_03450 [Endomicrobium sp.]|jgi:hypothetical protein|nr:hypothetical protein [Endomicrobium sp.]